jgi:hypothetical protein
MPVTERVTHLKLAVEVGSDPITGSLAVGGGDPRSFCGWIELVAEIEAARYNGEAAVPGIAVAQPETPGIAVGQPEKRLG